jgi:hypothetical protein
MIDLNNEQLLSLSQAAKLLPPGRGNRPASLSCVLIWVLNGIKSPSGQIVRLEAIRLGGRWLTSRQALQRFAEAQTPRLGIAQTPTRTPAKRQRASERAAKELEILGM